MWLKISIDHSETKESLWQLRLQEVDEEQTGKNRAEDRDQQCPHPGLREDEFDEKG